MENKVYSVPNEIDKMIAETKLEVMGIETDVLTDKQKKYLGGWEVGTQ